MAERVSRRIRQPIDLSGPGRVKQQFREESDINAIMARWRKTGILPSGTAKVPMYGDFSNADEYLTMSLKVMEAEASFKALPAAIRSRFDHSPAELIAFMDDPENLEEAIEMGIIPDPTPEPEPEPEPEPAPTS